MRVVKEQEKARVAAPVFADALDQLGLVPFVDDYQLRIIKRFFKLQLIRVVAVGPEFRISVMKVEQRLRAVFRDQVLHAPGIVRLVNLDLMSVRNQLGGNAAQEMGISVVPIRDQRLVKQHYAHCANFSCATLDVSNSSS